VTQFSVAALPALCLAMLSSCTTLELEVGDEISADSVSAFRSDETERHEVLAVLGAPTALAPCAGGSVLLYEWVVLDEMQFGLGLDSLGALFGVPELGLLKLSLGDSDAGRRAILFFFDSERVMRAASYADWTEQFGRGGSMQFFVSVQQVVDSGQLRDSLRSMDWGAELLEPPMALLNQAQLPAMELRGASAGFGQDTLAGEHAEEIR